MDLDAYVRAVVGGLQSEGFGLADPAGLPPDLLQCTQALLGRADDAGVQAVALTTDAGRLTAVQRTNLALARAAWAQGLQQSRSTPVRLVLVLLFAGDLNGRTQAELAALPQTGDGWQVAVWAVDPSVHFSAAFPAEAEAWPGWRALFAGAPAERRVRLQRPAAQRPWVTYGLLGACVLFYLFITLIERDLNATSDPNVMVSWGAQLAPLVWEGEHWRLLASVFMHWGIVHLAMNGFALWVLGRQVEELFGRVRFLVIFLVAGLAGNLLSLFLLRAYSPSAGASGAIFGLLGAFVYLKAGTPLGRRMAWGPLIQVLVINAIISLLPGVDLWGHLGGFLGGLLAGALVGLPDAGRSRLAAGLGLLLVTALTLTPVIPLGPSGVAVFQAGVQARERGDYATALSDLRQAVQINPGVGRYHLRLAEIYALTNDRPRAVQEVNQAVRLAPEDGWARDFQTRLQK